MNVTHALRRRRQGGEGKIGLIIVLVVIAFVVIVLVKYVPARVQNAAFAKDVEIAARDYVVGNIRGVDKLIVRVMSVAEESGIPLEEEAVQVTDTTQYVRVRVDYRIVLSMPWGEWPQEFRVEKEIGKL
jgi:hypothetical protein